MTARHEPTWPAIRIADAVGKIMDYRGRTPKKLGLDWGDGDIPAISARNVRMGHIDFSEEYYLASTRLYRRWMMDGDMEPGDVLITTEAPLGNVAAVPDSRKYILSQRTVLLRPGPGCFAKGFFLYALQSPRFQRLLEENATGSTALGIQRRRLEQLEVPMPPMAEQKAIAAALSDADDLIIALERLIAKKRAIKQGMMQELLTGRTRLPGFDEPWRRVKLEILGQFLKGRGIKRDEVRSSGVACIRYGEIYTTYRDYTPATASFVDSQVAATALPIAAGDILFAGSGETKEEIGTCVAYIGAIPAVAGGDIIVLRGRGYDPVFLASLLNTPTLAAVKARSGQGDAVVHINSRALAAIPVDVPSLPEQQAIAQVLREADTEIEALERRLDITRDIKQGMMQELLTGRTRLPVEEG